MVMMTKTAFLLNLLLGAAVSPSCFAQECTADGKCDQHERCPVWQQEGMCFREKKYMKEHCPASCAKSDEEKVTAATVAKECKDRHARCSVFADLGECEDNPDMKLYCAASCGACGKKDRASPATDTDASCKDLNSNCPYWAEIGECQENHAWMKTNCPKSCDACPKQKIPNKAGIDGNMLAIISRTAQYGELQKAEGTSTEATVKRMQESIKYMTTEKVRNLPDTVVQNCRNRHELCSFWAAIGECENNVAYMATNCAIACMSCHMIDFDTRCPPLVNPVPALVAGDLNKMFERIVATAPGNRTLTEVEQKELAEEGMTLYTVTVHSRPSDTPTTEVSAVVDKSLPPWVITFDNFVTPEECEAMIQLGYKYEYKRSEDVGGIKFDGTHEAVQSQKRTSENAWCSGHAGCRQEEIPNRLHERIAKVLGIPPENSEDFQMLKYEKNQFYRTHHDYIPHQKDRNCGPRILTFFLYLSDVEAGGGTDFPQLGITVDPKQGRALLWPSVLNSEPMLQDKRTTHQALDVIEGAKFAANGWIHMFDYVTPQKLGCN